MKILIIENDFEKKHKIWQLLCLATQNNMEMDFVEGKVIQQDVDFSGDSLKASLDEREVGFKSISVDVENIEDIRALRSFLEYWMEHEEYYDPDGITGEHEDD
jgi:hypothetical protein